MTEFREPEPDPPTTRTTTGVWTTRGPTTAAPVSAETPSVSWRAPTTAAASMMRLGVPGRWTLPSLQQCLRASTLVLAILLLAVFGLIFAYRWIAPPTTTLMLAQRLAGVHITRDWRSFDQISPYLSRAVVMSEDAAFCGHRGVDFVELRKAYQRGVDGGSRGGASTISMQVTKNLFLWQGRSYLRKAIEIPLTLAADRWWGKRRMMEIYLNSVEWGPGIFGAEAAARAYFHKSARDLGEQEAALMAVALPLPRLRNPAQPSAQQRRMARVIRGRMQIGARNVRCLGGEPATSPGVDKF